VQVEASKPQYIVQCRYLCKLYAFMLKIGYYCKLLLFDFDRRLFRAIVVSYFVNYYCLILSEDCFVLLRMAIL
jgi:hypothetical protein